MCYYIQVYTGIKMNIYLDMDDVVADWKKLAQQIVGRAWADGTTHLPDHEWSKVRDYKRFYRDLPLKEGAHDLVNYCREYSVKNNYFLAFLTALPHDDDVPFAAYDKVMWAQKHFPNIPVFFGPYSGDKWKHCTPGDILIDDRVTNCKQWIEVGGVAHIYTTWENCKPWLLTSLK
jgi:5'(3')-deoxyribonucleotidase